MNSYGTDMNGMQGMVLFMAVEYLHVLWVKLFGRQEISEVQPASLKATASQRSIRDLECCPTSSVG